MKNVEMFSVTIAERECGARLAQFALVKQDYIDPVDRTVDAGDEHLINFSLTPRPPRSRGSFVDKWQRGRFEHIGEVLVVPARHRMRGLSDRGCLTSLRCRLDPVAIDHWFESEAHWVDPWLTASLSVARPSISRILSTLAQEVRNPGLATDAMMELLTAQLTLELARYYGSVSEQPAAGGLAPWQLKLLDERLADFRVPPSLAELGHLCGLSARQLSRAFRASRGYSVGKHIEQSRMAAAKQLLDSGVSIKSIAYDMGFSSLSSFSFAFRRASGVSPRGYRQRFHS